MAFDEEELDPHGECRAEIHRLRDKLAAIHEITQDPSVSAWQKIQNIEATARQALDG